MRKNKNTDMKDKIIFKRFYLGEDKATIKKGELIWLQLDKKELINEYQYFDNHCILVDKPRMSLLTYVKEKVYEICLRGSLYN